MGCRNGKQLGQSGGEEKRGGGTVAGGGYGFYRTLGKFSTWTEQVNK